jgi:hypothetical protein
MVLLPAKKSFSRLSRALPRTARKFQHVCPADPFGSLAAWQLRELCQAHSFAPPPYDGFAFSRIREAIHDAAAAHRLIATSRTHPPPGKTNASLQVFSCQTGFREKTRRLGPGVNRGKRRDGESSGNKSEEFFFHLPFSFSIYQMKNEKRQMKKSSKCSPLFR